MRREKASKERLLFAISVISVVLLVSTVVMPGLAAAAGEEKSARAPVLDVVATVSVLRDFVEQIGGDRVSCVALVTGMENPHTYATTTADRSAIEEASVFVEFGGEAGPELEPWAQDLLDSSDNGGLVVCEAASGIPLIEDNPHVWMDPENAKTMVINIEKALIEADPSGASVYRNNTVSYLQRINETEERILEEMAPYSGMKVIASHPAFLYFFNFIGFEQVDLLVDVPGQSPSAQHVSEIIDEIREENISLIVTMPQFPTPVTDQIREETGVRSVEITPLLGAFNTTTYLGMLEYDAGAISLALSEGSRGGDESGASPVLMYSLIAIIALVALGAAATVYRRRER